MNDDDKLGTTQENKIDAGCPSAVSSYLSRNRCNLSFQHPDRLSFSHLLRTAACLPGHLEFAVGTEWDRESDNKCSRRREKKGKTQPTHWDVDLGVARCLRSPSESRYITVGPVSPFTSGPHTPSFTGSCHRQEGSPRPHPKPRARGLNPTFSARGCLPT